MGIKCSTAVTVTCDADPCNKQVTFFTGDSTTASEIFAEKFPNWDCSYNYLLCPDCCKRIKELRDNSNKQTLSILKAFPIVGDLPQYYTIEYIEDPEYPKFIRILGIHVPKRNYPEIPGLKSYPNCIQNGTLSIPDHSRGESLFGLAFGGEVFELHPGRLLSMDAFNYFHSLVSRDHVTLRINT